MPESPKLADLSLPEFARRLSERTPTPGGGSMAAYLVATGAGLVSMAFRFTSGEKYAAWEKDMARRVEELDALRARALELVDTDARSYDAVTAARKLPKATDAEKAAREAAIQRATQAAMDVPAETVERALAGLRVCAQGAAHINPNLASDCATGAMCLASAAESALLNVKINAASLADKARAHIAVERGESLVREANTLLANVRTAVAKHLSI